MFNSAKIKLTLSYVVVIATITFSISGIFYIRTVFVLEDQYTKIESRLRHDMPGFTWQPRENKVRLQYLNQELSATKKQIAKLLLLVNAGILSIVAVAGYYLAQKTLEPIEKAHIRQKQFISDAAHELKTPITALKTATEVALMDAPKSAKEILSDNLDNIKSLEKLTKSLLSLSSYEETNLDQVPIDLVSLLKKAIKLMSGLAEKNDVSLSIKTPQKAQIIGNEGAILDLFINLIDNAVKFSPKDSNINILVTAKKSKTTVMIQDQGEGIPKEDLPRIFDRFYQADSSRTKNNQKGFGLGLSIAKSIADAHGAKLDIKSQIDKGTTVVVEFS